MRGDRGITGPTGDKGPTGPTGDKGPSGDKGIQGATLVLHVVDANKRGGVDSINKNSIKVLNKCDLLDSIPSCEDGEVCVSAATGFGFDNLIELVLIRLGLSSSTETSLLSRRRHVDSLESALFLIR